MSDQSQISCKRIVESRIQDKNYPLMYDFEAINKRPLTRARKPRPYFVNRAIQVLIKKLRFQEIATVASLPRDDDGACGQPVGRVPIRRRQ